jgi:hypothetical protein
MKTLCLIVALVAALPLEAARTFVRASNQWLSVSTAVVSAEPLTLSVWFKTNDLTVNQIPLGLLRADATGGRYLNFRGATAGDPLAAVSFDGSTGQALSAGSVSSGVWTHGGAVFTSTSSRAVFLNGSKDTDTTLITGATPDNTLIGAFASGNSNFSGEIAEAAVWNVALTDQEMASLAAGCSPLRVRPSALVFYAPLSPGVFDYRAGVTITNNNTSTVAADHPRIYRSP